MSLPIQLLGHIKATLQRRDAGGEGDLLPALAGEKDEENGEPQHGGQQDDAHARVHLGIDRVDATEPVRGQHHKGQIGDGEDRQNGADAGAALGIIDAGPRQADTGQNQPKHKGRSQTRLPGPPHSPGLMRPKRTCGESNRDTEPTDFGAGL